MQHLSNLRHIFRKSVEAVLPSQLLSPENNYYLRPKPGNRVTIQIQGKTVDITRKRCYVVGFGKAVLGMAVQLERELGGMIVAGVISVPSGTLQQFQSNISMQLSPKSCIKVYEGASGNQPDERAMETARRIKLLATEMTQEDVLFVLISGGGSALLPLPRAPLTLNEKMKIVRQLSHSGANISEMNTVRIALSDIKGGRLAFAARNAHAIISFVISDIVGDPVDLIASGPTCSELVKRPSAQRVLQKYCIWEQLPLHLRHFIASVENEINSKPGRNNAIYVVGDNRVAATRAVQEALHCGYNPFIASTTVQGEVQELVQIYSTFLHSICCFRRKQIGEEQLKEQFPFDPRTFRHFLKTVIMCEKTGKPLLLILCGEPTIKVTGNGVGGRNQELSLRMSLKFYQNEEFADISFLSAGTDGIDGPTPVAGAIGSPLVISDFLKDKTNSVDRIKEYLENNNSYEFYKNLSSGAYHVITGHTGTNVMDLQLLLVA